jgi:hypothetical protein
MSYAEQVGQIYKPPFEVAKKFWEIQKTIAEMGGTDDNGKLYVADEFQQAFHISAAPKIGDSNYPVLNDAVVYAAENYPDREPINIGHNLMRAGQSSIRRHAREFSRLTKIASSYPDGFDDPETWDLMFFEELERDPEEKRFLYQNLDFNTQTNWKDRYALPWAGAVMMGMAGDTKNILDEGCSLEIGLKQWALPRSHWPWQHIDVMDQPPEGGPPVRNPRATEQFMRMLNEVAIPVDHAIGIDLQDTTDNTSKKGKELHEFIFDCPYPSEFKNRAAQLYDAMRIASMQFPSQELAYFYPDDRQPRIDFYQGNITQLDHPDFQRTYPGFTADIILRSTVIHQIGEWGLQAAERNEAPYVHEGTAAFTLDFIDAIYPNSEVKLSPKWGPFTYKLFGRLGTKMPNLHLLSAKNGRVPEVIPTDIAVELAYEQGYDISPQRY